MDWMFGRRRKVEITWRVSGRMVGSSSMAPARCPPIATMTMECPWLLQRVQVARISGETAPLLFTSLNNQFWSVNPNEPMASLPVAIFQMAMSPYEDWHRLAWSGALIITMAVLTLSITARVLESPQERR